MSARCNQTGCFAPKGMCANGHFSEYKKCEHWKSIQNTESDEKKQALLNGDKLPWNGAAFIPNDIQLISVARSPIIIGMIGSADAGKTSYLGMFFRLLFNGKQIENMKFSGSYTLAAWEMLAQYLIINNGGKVTFPPPTPSNPDFYSLYHLTIKQNNTKHEFLFADSSGEVFLKWSNDVNESSVENARWIYQNSSCFIFFIDSEAIIQKKGEAVQEINQLLLQVATNLNGRPIVFVWSKSDRLSEVKTNLYESINSDINYLFNNPTILNISNISRTDDDEYCHKNNIMTFQTLIEKYFHTNSIKTSPIQELEDKKINTDYFLKMS